MKTLSIDIETYSGADLAECGVYRYAEHPDFRILLFAYAVDYGPVEVVSIATGERLPEGIFWALTDTTVTKTAFNATFERVCLSRWLRDRAFLNSSEFLDPEQWDCTMVAAARCGLPLSLAQCGEVLGLDEKDEGKMKEGKALIRKFSCPNRKGERTLPEDDPDAWEVFKAYCQRDVEVEQSIRLAVTRFTQPRWESELYAIDQRINDRGVLIDRRFVECADRLADEYTAQLLEKAKRITGLENPNSPAQLKTWLREKTGVIVPSLNKAEMDDIEKTVGAHGVAGKVLRLRMEMGKTSVKKYAAMLDCVCRDGRIRGLLQYYGAARTGRWAGRLVQVQNLPQNHLKDLDEARRLVKAGDLDDFTLNYGNPTQVLSELIRTAFVAGDGMVFHVCDFSAIEARVTAWLAGERWVLDVFREGGDIYCATASQMFSVPVEKHGANSELRAKGKIAVLALGYGGGVSALDNMGGQKMGLTQKDEAEIVNKWRTANPHIVRLWEVVERSAKRAIMTGRTVKANMGLEFGYERGCLTVQLPSGRKLVYPRAKVEEYMKTRFERPELTEAVTYEGQNQTTKKWERMETYGGKMVENIVQATARDILAWVMFRAERDGLPVVFHVHDEIIVEADPNKVSLEEVEKIFSEPVEWAEGLPLKGAGYTTPYYMKD